MQQQQPEPMLTAADLVRWLALSKTTIYDLTARGELPAVRIGRAIRYQPCAIRAWLDAQRVAVVAVAQRAPEE